MNTESKPSPPEGISSPELNLDEWKAAARDALKLHTDADPQRPTISILTFRLKRIPPTGEESVSIPLTFSACDCIIKPSFPQLWKEGFDAGTYSGLVLAGKLQSKHVDAFRQALAAESERRQAPISIEDIFSYKFNAAEGTQSKTLFESIAESINAMPSVRSKRADGPMIYPTDKLNANVWSLFESDAGTTIPIPVESSADRKKGKRIDVLYRIDFDELPENIKITKVLTQTDKRVHAAICALLDAGNEYVSYSQIFDAMGSTRRPGTSDIERISESVKRLMYANIYINNSAEAARYGYDRTDYHGRLIGLETIDAYINGKLVKNSVHIERGSRLQEYAKGHRQVTEIPRAVLQSNISKTELNLAIEDYLLGRIARITDDKAGTQARRILYQTIFEHVRMTSNSKKARLPDKVKAYLDHYVKCGYIAGYTDDADGITIRPRAQKASIPAEKPHY